MKIKKLFFICFDLLFNFFDGATNIYKIAKNELERPTYLCREKKKENVKVENPKKDKIKNVVLSNLYKPKRVKTLNQLGGGALTKS